MRRTYLRLIEDQSKVKVAERTLPLAGDQAKGHVWFVTLAVGFAGVFYFWYYYFGDDWWRGLAGG
jgi:hypothetical protein